jgi:hypothetical protein
LDSVDNAAGIYLEVGSLKCKNCMSEEDWKNLMFKQIINKEEFRKDEEWIYCDCCEQRL